MEDSRLREGNMHLHLAYDDEEDEEARPLSKQPTNHINKIL